MKEVLDKITSYNLFNHLLPGVIFTVLLEGFTRYSFIQKDIIIGAFIYYFAGLVVSRFGSLVVEPVLKKVSFLKFVEYKAFLSASKKDPKIELLSEANNVYRTFSSMLILLALFKFYELLELKYQILGTLSPYVLIGLLLIMFILSYKKQTEYITKRVDASR